MSDNKKPVQHAELGIDGNAAFALLGENIQEGEAEFEAVVQMHADDPMRREPLHKAQDRASRIGFNRLRERLDPKREWLTYWLGPSHPLHR